MSIKSILKLTGYLFGSILGLTNAHASIICSIGSSGLAADGIYLGSAITVVRTLTVTCTRSANDTSTSTAVEIVAGPGTNYSGSGSTRRVEDNSATTAYLTYDLSSTSVPGGNPRWGTNAPGGLPTSSKAVSLTINFGATSTSPTTISGNVQYTVSLAASQVYTASRTYVDSVPLTLTCTNTCTGDATRAIAVTINTSQTCSLTTPTDMALVYTSFQTVSSTAVSNFGVNCTASGTAYWISLNSPAASAAVADTLLTVNDSMLDLNHSLTLLKFDLTTFSNVGLQSTSAQQNYVVRGTIPANQTGTCVNASCTSSKQHTVYVNY